MPLSLPFTVAPGKLRAYVYLNGGASHRTDAQYLKGGAGGSLLALFDGVALARVYLVAVHRDSLVDLIILRGLALRDARLAVLRLPHP